VAFNLKNRSFLKEIDFTPQELRFLLQLSETLKSAKYAGTETHHLAGKNIALIFEKTSTRTRSAFEVGAYDQGAHVTYLDPSGSQLRHKESIADTASVLGRMYDAIEYRGNAQADVEELAEHAGVPVYNGLTDEWHPTQMLADFLTMHESSHKPYDAIAYAFTRPPTWPTSPARSPNGPARALPSRRTRTRRSAAWTSSTPTYGCPWASPRTYGPSVSRS
jgi:ornithine carbamoyltransferase